MVENVENFGERIYTFWPLFSSKTQQEILRSLCDSMAPNALPQEIKKFFDYIFDVEMNPNEIPANYKGYRKCIEKYFLESTTWKNAQGFNSLILSDRYRIEEEFKRQLVFLNS